MITALALNCTLKPSPETSSTQRLVEEVLAEMAKHGAHGEQVRIADFDVKPGVDTDMAPTPAQ